MANGDLPGSRMRQVEIRLSCGAARVFVWMTFVMPAVGFMLGACMYPEHALWLMQLVTDEAELARVMAKPQVARVPPRDCGSRRPASCFHARVLSLHVGF